MQASIKTTLFGAAVAICAWQSDHAMAQSDNAFLNQENVNACSQELAKLPMVNDATSGSSKGFNAAENGTVCSEERTKNGSVSCFWWNVMSGPFYPSILVKREQPFEGVARNSAVLSLHDKAGYPMDVVVSFFSSDSSNQPTSIFTANPAYKLPPSQPIYNNKDLDRFVSVARS